MFSNIPLWPLPLLVSLFLLAVYRWCWKRQVVWKKDGSVWWRHLDAIEENMYLHESYESRAISSTYITFRSSKEVPVFLVTEIIQELANIQPMLNVCFKYINGFPAAVTCNVKVNVKTKTAKDWCKAMQDFWNEEAVLQMDKTPPWNTALIRVQDEPAGVPGQYRYVLCMCLSHIVGDGVSSMQFLASCIHRLRARLNGKQLPDLQPQQLHPGPIHFCRKAILPGWINSARYWLRVVLHRHLGVWLNTRDYNADDFNVLRYGSGCNVDSKIGLIVASLSREETSSLRRIIKKHDCKMQAVLQAAAVIALAKVLSKKGLQLPASFIVCIPVNMRKRLNANVPNTYMGCVSGFTGCITQVCENITVGSPAFWKLASTCYESILVKLSSNEYAQLEHMNEGLISLKKKYHSNLEGKLCFDDICVSTLGCFDTSFSGFEDDDQTPVPDEDQEQERVTVDAAGVFVDSRESFLYMGSYVTTMDGALHWSNGYSSSVVSSEVAQQFVDGVMELLKQLASK